MPREANEEFALKEDEFVMKKMLVLAALASTLCFASALAGGNGQGGNGQGGNGQGGNGQGGYRGAPGPIAGAGLPFLVVGGAGFGFYWLVRRSRRKHS
jgi:hypothetical protein